MVFSPKDSPWGFFYLTENFPGDEARRILYLTESYNAQPIKI